MEWQAMLLLGAYHGINPGMGWLFAVALGMQQQSARGVYLALPPIALGHAAAVGSVLLVGGLLGIAVPSGALKIALGSLLLLLGAYRLWRHRHPRFGGMQVGFRDLTIWSFLMASAHGAGLMVLPFVMELSSEVAAAGGGHASHAALAGSAWAGTAAVGVHSLAYLAVTTLTAWLVYHRLGLALLRTAWLNLDWLWAAALAATGIVVLLG